MVFNFTKKTHFNKRFANRKCIALEYIRRASLCLSLESRCQEISDVYSFYYIISCSDGMPNFNNEGFLIKHILLHLCSGYPNIHYLFSFSFKIDQYYRPKNKWWETLRKQNWNWFPIRHACWLKFRLSTCSARNR